MLLVANQLQNTQLTAPKLFSSSKKKNQEESNDDNNGADVEDVVNAAAAAAAAADNFSQSAINNAASVVGKATASATKRLSATTSIKSKLPKDFDAAASQLLNSSLKHRNDCMKRVKRNSIHVAFVVYLLIGVVAYATDKKNLGAHPYGSVGTRVIMGYYESITIGFSVGLGTKDPDYV